MATQLQIRRGTSSQVAAFTGAEGEIVVNTTNDSVHVNDGSTAGGFEMARVDGSNWNVTNNISTTGSLTAASLLVDTTTLVVDATNNRVGIGTSIPSDALHVLDSSGNAYASIARGTQSQGEVGLRLRGGTSGNDWYVYQKTSSNNLNFYNTADRVTIDSSGGVIFKGSLATHQTNAGTAGYESNIFTLRAYGASAGTGEFRVLTGGGGGSAASEAMRIDSLGRFLLGQTANVSGFALQLEGSGGSASDLALDSSASIAELQSFNSKPLHINRQGNNVILNQDGGNVGIGTSSPNVSGYDANASALTISGTNRGLLELRGATGANSTQLGALRFLSGSTSEADIICELDGSGNGFLTFDTNGSEAMRISGGNLLVNRTSAFTTAKLEIQSDAGDASTLALNSIDTDGSMLEFYKAGNIVGSIGAVASQLYVAGGDTGLQLNGTADQIRPCDGSGAARDAAIDLGDSTRRFKDLYRSGSTISTSDRNLKQDIRDLTDAERNVAVAAKGLLKAFRFIDTVAAEGDSANIHFGIIAQDLAAAFTAEGLDANDYQVYRADTFTDDDGNEQTRLGICYENLLAFIIAAI